MKTLGLDIGTTTISAVVWEGGRVLTAKTLLNDTFLPGAPFERLQDPDAIWEKCNAIIAELRIIHPEIAAIGLTGQMHGILYLDKDGNAVSPLYTWQDGRGDLPFDDNSTFVSHLSEITGFPLATGFGLVTHAYNLRHSLVPKEAAVLCTISDYIAMKLAGLSSPVIDPTNAASLGLFHLTAGQFDGTALESAGIDPKMLPKIAASPLLGIGPTGIPVYRAIGDNQASFLGAAGGHTDVLLINVGTGSQISVFSPEYLQTDTLETRPFPDGGWLLVGASLCGGRSYALLERFFRQAVQMVTGAEESVYTAMSRALDEAGPIHNIPTAVTTFQGTRKDPALRGSFTGIDTENFTPVHFIYSVLQGMVDELFQMYAGFLRQGRSAPKVIIGSGNGLRKNKHLCRIFEETFDCELILSENDEEAACGAALYAAKHCR